MKNKKYTLFLIGLFWRMLLFIPLLLGLYIPFRKGYDYTLLSHFTNSPILKSFSLISAWGNFDGVHYLNIAGLGYTTNARFMPFYPFVIRLISIFLQIKTVFSLSQFLVAFSLSQIFCFASFYFLYYLIKIDFDIKKSKEAIIYLLLFPTSFFFGSVYSEGLFLLTFVLSIYFTRKNKWLSASLFGILGSATRIIGFIILPVLLTEYYIQKQKSIRNLFFILLTPLGSFLYMIYNYIVWKNPFYFLQAQGELSNGRATSNIVFPFQTIYRYMKILISVSPANYDWWIALLEFVVFWFCIYLFYEMWKQKIRISYIVFTACGFLIPVLSGTLTGLPRYVLPLFPFFITIAGIKNKKFKIIYGVIGVILTILLLAFFSRGYFIA